MIRIFYLTMLIIILCMELLQSQTNKYQSTLFDSPYKKSQFLEYLAKNYTSNAYLILQKSGCDFYTKYANGKSHYKILSSFAIVVHESCHYVNDDIGGFFGCGFYISPDIEIKASKSKVFKSSELDKNIPDEWKNNIFRYKTYIQGSNEEEEITSVSEGIYGLMDEFDSYYQSTKATVELFNYYKSISTNSETYYWELYISNCYSSVFAYYEFRLFIAWYLKYARKNYPDIYKAIIQNKELKAAYTLINKGYEKTVRQYFENRKNIIENINKTGVKTAKISEKYFIIKAKNKNETTSKGYGIPDSEILYLKSLLSIEDYQMLNLLTIENLNETNYQAFAN